MIRQPGVCNGDPDTTVLCHLRMVDVTGMGIKAVDLLGAWGCSDCHRYCDTHGIDGRTALLEGMARTQAYLLNAGLIELKGERHAAPVKIPKIFRRPMA
jgi:hypothetical protein